MRHRRDDVVARALRVLDDHGLADLTMRRLGTELGVQPSAVYHHFPSKQVLLAAVADEILARGARPLPEGAWDDRARAACHTLRDACLAWTDGAEVVATARAFGLGARAPYDELVGVLVDGGIRRRAGGRGGPDAAPLRARPRDGRADPPAGRQRRRHRLRPHRRDHSADFATGVDLVLAGLLARVRG